MSIELKSDVYSTAVLTPELILVAFLILKLEKDEIQSKLNNPKSNRTTSFAKVINGKIKTVENKFSFKLDIHNFTVTDDITINLETGRSHLSCGLYGNIPKKNQVFIFITSVWLNLVMLLRISFQNKNPFQDLKMVI